MFGLLSVTSEKLSGDISSFLSFVKEAFLTIRISDVIDILLLATLFFFAFRFLKNRKVGALIVGILICLVAYVLATIFGLSGLKFILSSIFKIGALALIIIFQPEIRELVEKVGTGSLKGLRGLSDKAGKKKLHYKVIDDICKAAQILSVERTGALIVIERTTKLDEIIHTGTPLNADISDSLLRNIFYNRAPLHDGAVIISDGKISAAACILPLPRRTIVSGDLGTRHRAAVGVGEISDALTIIVSEETGIISVATEGELIRNFTAESLRKYLVKEIIHENPLEGEN
jgi:diadenylate cyclase